MEEKMRIDKLKGKPTSIADTSSSNDIDSTEPGNESAETETPPAQQHFQPDGSQIDDEGQNHNIDDAVQYVDETDTVDPAPPRPPATISVHETDPQTPALIVNHPIEYLSPTTEEVLVANQAPPQHRIIVPDEEEDVTSRHEEHRPADSGQNGAAPTGPTARPNAVHVESERVEVIEIKSDGSSGHLIHSEYH